MAGKGGTTTAPPLPPPPVVCCMCGDRGLAQELFRCKVCSFRSQHTYCSDLYPKAELYCACNWCLREEGTNKPMSKEEARQDQSNAAISCSNSMCNGSSGSGCLKLHRGDFPAQLNKPIKKQRLQNRPATVVDIADRPRPAEEAVSPPSSGKGRQGFRGKVRRYKLLEEVSS